MACVARCYCAIAPSVRAGPCGLSPHDRASPRRGFLAVYGRHRGRPRAFQSRDRALRSCRASSAGDAIWRGHRGDNFVFSVVGLVDAWLTQSERWMTILILAGVVADGHRCHRSVANQCQCNVSYRAYRNAGSYNRDRNKREPHVPFEHRTISNSTGRYRCR